MSEIVIVTEPDYDVNVDAVHDSTLTVTDEGEQGPQGPQGPPGDAEALTFTQPFTAVSSVLVTHNLGYEPAVQVIVGGVDIRPGVRVVHTSANQLTVSWNGVLTGKVVCS